MNEMEIETKYKDYLLNLGLDLDDESHPFSAQYLELKRVGNHQLYLAFEHLILKLILDLEVIKQHSQTDYNYHSTKISIKDISFWGERFEIYWYSSLIQELTDKSIRRGTAGEEADFVFKHMGQDIGIETTALNFDNSTYKKNPIAKIERRIKKKESAKYCNYDCCLAIDISNLQFYRKLLNNFSITISDLINSLSSNFGAILFCESIHTDLDSNVRYITQVYDWMNPNISEPLKDYLTSKFKNSKPVNGSIASFKIG